MAGINPMPEKSRELRDRKSGRNLRIHADFVFIGLERLDLPQCVPIYTARSLFPHQNGLGRSRAAN